MASEPETVQCSWQGCTESAIPGRVLCERHCSNQPRRWKPKAKPTIESATALLTAKSVTKRKQGMEQLVELHADDLILRFALEEPNSEVFNVAWHALEHRPIELIQRVLTLTSAYDSTLLMRFSIARGNYLYAEKTIYGVYAGRKTLTLKVIDSFGRAYLRSLAGLLHKFLNATLELYHDAFGAKGQKEVAGVEGIDMFGWSRNGWAAIYAVIALTRLDAEFDVSEAERLIHEAEQVQLHLPQRDYQPEARERIDRTILRTRACLEWALFDKGVRQSPQKAIGLVRDGAIEVLPDLALTLLKQGKEKLLLELTSEFPVVYFIQGEFCFWPLINWLTCNGILAKNEFGEPNRGALDLFWRALNGAADPPPWWKWTKVAN